jgi:hypothetical protein
VWDVDVTQSGKVCVTSARNIQLWRPDSDSSSTVQIRSADGKAQDLSWAAGKALTAWPASLPMNTGATYDVEWPASGDKSKLEMVVVQNPPADMMGAAQVLIQNGCQNQLELLVQSASKSTK